MHYEVIVVGGGIGGLTAAAVLAKRGVSVCLLERQSYVGGCAARVEHSGLQFDPTHGLFSGWEEDGVFDRLCAELEVRSPLTQALRFPYVVRLADGSDVARTANIEERETILADAFPECAKAAIDFYRGLASSIATRTHDNVVAKYLQHCSPRFRSFIDVQLQTLVQCSSDECSQALAAEVLNPQRKFFDIEGGVQSLIDLLARCFQQHGGKLRLNSPVLRLAYGTNGLPIAVDLLNGERLLASRAIISNLTIWDTYGKLIGPQRIPPEVSATLKQLRASSVYQVFLTIRQGVAATLPANRFLIGNDRPFSDDESQAAQFVFSIHPRGATADIDMRTAVVTVNTRAEDWFSFHEDNNTFEERDQSMLENVWADLHSALPNVCNGAEVIETATPQTYYETLRRRFGMVGRPVNESTYAVNIKPYSGLWLAGDTVTTRVGIDAVVESSWRTAREIIQ
ncbi:MAG TPA: FAD-dependent oxidoreductase [Pyrinomonadaceae bacterium]|jgi:phytoene dehydrogenase-like protein|nr:FAD-dependent oxidoreductase [Pyrinomonadaceae bacterium]